MYCGAYQLYVPAQSERKGDSGRISGKIGSSVVQKTLTSKASNAPFGIEPRKGSGELRDKEQRKTL